MSGYRSRDLVRSAGVGRRRVASPRSAGRPYRGAAGAACRRCSERTLVAGGSVFFGVPPRNSRRTRAKVFLRSVSTLGTYRNVGSRIDFMRSPSSVERVASSRLQVTRASRHEDARLMVKGAGTSVNRTYTVFDVGERYLSVGLVPKFGGDAWRLPLSVPNGAEQRQNLLRRERRLRAQSTPMHS